LEDKMLSVNTSMRLEVLRFPLIVGVVFIHSYDSDVAFQGTSIGVAQTNYIFNFVRNLISQGIGRIAVPLLFLISGYLFSYGFELSMEGYVAKIKSRLQSLLIPFIFWNIATLTVIAAAQSIPITAVYFSGRNALVENFSGPDYFSAIFGIGRMPISYQFWFIRDLLVLVLFAPILLKLCQYLSLSFLFSLIVIWSTEIWPISVPSSEAILFFSIGCWLGIGKKNIFMFDHVGQPIFIAYAIVVISGAVCYGTAFGNGIHKLSILLGMVSALWLTKAAIQSSNIKRHLLRIGGASFFVYAAHEPLLTILRKLIFKLLQPQSPYLLILLYFVIPCLVILLILLVQPRLKAAFPRFIWVINGGR